MELNIPDFFKTDSKPKEATAPELPAIPEQAPLLAKEAKEEAYTQSQSLKVYKAYQENIQQSSQLQTEILKGAKQGEKLYSLLLKACKAISAMTGNNLFYDTVKTDTMEIYGVGLAESEPLEQDIAETGERLEKLIEAAEREPENTWIKKAIKAHRERLERLEKLHNR